MGFVELFSDFISFFAKLTSWKDTIKHNDPAKNTTDLVPIYQDKTKLKLEDSKEVTAGSEMSREALNSIFTKSSSHF